MVNKLYFVTTLKPLISNEGWINRCVGIWEVEFDEHCCKIGLAKPEVVLQGKVGVWGILHYFEIFHSASQPGLNWKSSQELKNILTVPKTAQQSNQKKIVSEWTELKTSAETDNPADNHWTCSQNSTPNTSLYIYTYHQVATVHSCEYDVILQHNHKSELNIFLQYNILLQPSIFGWGLQIHWMRALFWCTP